MPIRKFTITGVAVQVEFKNEFNPYTLEQINKRFEGMIQLDIVSNGDFSDFDAEKLQSLIINYFKGNPKLMLPDIIRSSN